MQRNDQDCVHLRMSCPERRRELRPGAGAGVAAAFAARAASRCSSPTAHLEFAVAGAAAIAAKLSGQVERPARRTAAGARQGQPALDLDDPATARRCATALLAV